MSLSGDVQKKIDRVEKPLYNGNKEVRGMINNPFYVKTVLTLQERKKKVESVYSAAGWLGYWLPLFLFGVMVFWWVCRLFVMDLYMLGEIFADTNLQVYKLNFICDILILVIPLIYLPFGHFAFGVRNALSTWLLMVFDAGVVILSVTAIFKNFSPAIYIGAIAYAVLNLIVCICCLKAYVDDELLKKIDGYPHFNATLMYEDEPEVSLLRFRDKKTFNELYDERMEEFVEGHPDALMSDIYRKEKEAEHDAAVEDFLSGMFIKNKKTD